MIQTDPIFLGVVPRGARSYAAPRDRVPWQAPLQPLRRPLQRDRGRSRVRVPSVGVYVLLIDTSCFTGVYLFLLFLYSYTAEMS